MRKYKRGRKLSREKDQRKALLKSLAGALFLKGRIKTTEAKAKEVSSSAEKLISSAKKMDLVSRKTLARFLAPKIAKKMAEEIGPRYKDRKGGYTRIIKLGQRKSDGAKMAIIELVK